MTSDDPSEMDTDDFLDSITEETEMSIKGDFDDPSGIDMSTDTVAESGEVAKRVYELATNVAVDPLPGDRYGATIERAPDIETISSFEDPSADIPEYETYTIEVTPEVTKALLNRIADEIEKREKQGYDIDEIVLGAPQYETLKAWALEEYADEPEHILPVTNVIVVPGPMIHPVIDNRRMLMEYQSKKHAEESDDDD